MNSFDAFLVRIIVVNAVIYFFVFVVCVFGSLLVASAITNVLITAIFVLPFLWIVGKAWWLWRMGEPLRNGQIAEIFCDYGIPQYLQGVAVLQAAMARDPNRFICDLRRLEGEVDELAGKVYRGQFLWGDISRLRATDEIVRLSNSLLLAP